MPELNGHQRLRDTIETLLGPDGCAWHREQTHESLVRYLIEEAAELAEAIEAGEGPARVREELGDVLYQVLFHAAIAQRDGEGYDLEAVMLGLNHKLIRRHPHVFGGREQMTVAELNAEWEALKAAASDEAAAPRGVLDGIPAAMPGLARAAKVIDRIARADTPETRAALAAALDAPLDEGRESVAERGSAAAEELALGRELLARLVSAQAAGLDPDRALRTALRALEEAVGSGGARRG